MPSRGPTMVQELWNSSLPYGLYDLFSTVINLRLILDGSVGRKLPFVASFVSALVKITLTSNFHERHWTLVPGEWKIDSAATLFFFQDLHYSSWHVSGLHPKSWKLGDEQLATESWRVAAAFPARDVSRDDSKRKGRLFFFCRRTIFDVSDARLPLYIACLANLRAPPHHNDHISAKARTIWCERNKYGVLQKDGLYINNTSCCTQKGVIATWLRVNPIIWNTHTLSLRACQFTCKIFWNDHLSNLHPSSLYICTTLPRHQHHTYYIFTLFVSELHIFPYHSVLQSPCLNGTSLMTMTRPNSSLSLLSGK